MIWKTYRIARHQTRPLSSCSRKRRQLLSAGALQFGKISHISESSKRVSTIALLLLHGYVSNRPDSAGWSIFPDRSDFSPNNNSLSSDRSASHHKGLFHLIVIGLLLQLFRVEEGEVEWYRD